MGRRSRLWVAGLLAVTLTALTACSQHEETPSAEFCRLVTTDPLVAQAITLNGEQITDEQIAALRHLTEAAPAADRDDWRTFTDYLDALSNGDEAKLDKNLDKAMAAADTVQKSIEACLPPTATPTATPSAPTSPAPLGP